ncbi:extracellular solute-binding protein [Nonomuraea lactucae]|uniref:extracellular solute-binding protein n=1 Tax=Nonomuraea lactucae TaxID=2249762 RepID=UPI000DE23528|nr:extracellular solute-binding protein [Nonomuraea lactucae]
MQRTKLLAIPLVGTVMSLLAACGGSAGTTATPQALTFVSYGAGAYQNGQQQAWVDPFQKQKGVKITIDAPSDNAKLKTMVEAGKVTWDVVDTDPFFAMKYCGKYTDTIDVGDLKPNFPPGTLSDCAVPAAFFGLIFMYNTNTYGTNPPTRLADFFDAKKFPGKRSISGSIPTNGRLEAALLADGVAPDQLYPLDIKRALEVYGRVKPDIAFAQTYGQQQQTMVGNQADLALLPSARAYSVLKAGGTSWKPVWDKVPVTWDALVIPKGSPHKDLAQQFIQFASQPAQAQGFANLSGIGAANTAATGSSTGLMAEVDPFTAERKPKQVLLNADWWAQNIDNVTAAWTNWMSG